jgi:hypothetical protein
VCALVSGEERLRSEPCSCAQYSLFYLKLPKKLQTQTKMNLENDWDDDAYEVTTGSKSLNVVESDIQSDIVVQTLWGQVRTE